MTDDARNKDNKQQVQKGSAETARASHSESTESAAPSPLRDWRDSTLRLLSEIKGYWTDRKTILENSTAMRGCVQLKSRPFNSALNGLVLPSLLIGIGYSAISAVYPLSPSQVDRAIEEKKDLRKFLDDAMANPRLQATGSEPPWSACSLPKTE